jgi:hypothetical protein
LPLKKNTSKLSSKSLKKFPSFSAIKSQINVNVQDLLYFFGDFVYNNVFKSLFNPKLTCTKLNLCDYEVIPLTVEDYARDILNTPKKENKEKNSIKKSLNETNDTYKFLHFTDMHFGWDYLQGTEADCGLYNCCFQT